jgi:hypothetical protein
MAAVGRAGPKELLSEKLQAREARNDRRKLPDSIFECRKSQIAKAPMNGFYECAGN